MAGSIWTSTVSKYGQVNSDAKPVSTSTAYRWLVKDDHKKHRKSKSLKLKPTSILQLRG